MATRYFPKFEWSVLWTYNIFRVLESIFGRKEGIVLEQICDSRGNVYSFTLENYLATIEGAIRAWFSKNLGFRIVIVPQYQLAGFKRNVGFSPYLFAIAFDTAQVVLGGASGSPLEWSHTVTGSNPFLLVVNDSTTPPTNNYSAISYNSVAMTSQVLQAGDSNWGACAIWSLGNPSTGANTVSCTFTGTVGFYNGSASYSGCQSSSTPDNKGGQGAASHASPEDFSLTSVADNCWHIAWFQAADVALVAGTGTTSRATNDTFERWLDNNAAITPAGSNTLQCTWVAGNNRVMVVGVTIAPFSAAGPTNLKSLDTNLKANIKSYNTNLIANVKSINTNA